MTQATAAVEVAEKTLSKREIIRDELQRLAKKNGNVTPEMVVQSAKRPGSPLHQFFEWDDSEAARKYRLDQARQLIMTVRVMTEIGESRPVRALIPLYDNTKRFFSRADVMSKRDERAVQVERALMELRSWVSRWSDVGELDEIRGAVEKML